MDYLKVCSGEACDGVRETERGREKENKDTVLDAVLGNVQPWTDLCVIVGERSGAYSIAHRWPALK